MNALAKPVIPAEQTFAMLDVDDISASPLNHREIFKRIEELGQDIKANGLRVPIKVRPTPGAKTPYQLVYGERRWRAAKHAKVKQLPALIRELNDTEVIEEQLVENVGREDVHPMEEAEGYDELLQKHSYDVDMIVKKTGKSRTAVYNRLKLLKLCPKARRAFLEDKINASIAELIARIPTSKLQESAIGEILRGRHENQWDLNSIGDEDEDHDHSAAGVKVNADEVLPLSFREAQILIQRRYMLRLELAPFDKADALLHPEAGACTKCIYRTGNQPDLFNDVPSTDVCTNPPCFETKKNADWKRKSAEAKKDGKEVLSEDEAEKIFNGDRIAYGAPFYDLKAEADWEFQPKKGKRKTWGDVLGKETPAITLAKDDGGAAHELVGKNQAISALKAAGRLPKDAEPLPGRGGGTSQASKKLQREKQKMRELTAAIAIGEIAADQHDTLKEILWLTECVIRQASMESHQATCDRRAIEPKKGSRGPYGGGRAPREDALLEYAGTLKEKGELLGLVRELLAWENACGLYRPGWGDNLANGAKTFKLDLKKLHDKVIADFKQAKAEKATKKKPAAKKKAA